MILPEQHQENAKRMNRLIAKGYRFYITADGYMVWFGEKYLGGASVILPRRKPLHWKHRRANLKNNLEQALLTVDRTKL